MNFIVRSYRHDDRDALRQIAYDTAFMGDSGEIFFDGETFLKDALTAYFTEYEPEHIWVAEADGAVIGYIMGAKDEERLKDVHMTRILPQLLVEILRSGILFSRKNWKIIGGLFKGVLQGEFSTPPFNGDYPAILHINLKDSARGSGAGAALMAVLLDVFSKEGIKGVRLATMSEKAADFFRKQGFILLFEGRRSYLQDVFGKCIPVFILGRRLLPV